MKVNLVKILGLLAGTVLMLGILLPLFWMISSSTMSSKVLLSYPPTLIPQTIYFENYLNLFRNTSFVTYCLNSLLVAMIVVAVVDLTAVLGAYGLSRFVKRGKGFLEILPLLGYMVAPIMMVIPFYLVMKWFDLVNTRFSLILVHTSFCYPFALWLMKSYIDDVPIELERSARIDGAHSGQVLTYVVLPLVSPGLIAVSIFTFILSWNDYVFARILISGDALKTIPIGLEDIYRSTVVDWGMLMAAGVMVSVPILIGFVLINRFFVKTLGFMGLKG